MTIPATDRAPVGLSGRISGFDGLRALAAYWVLLFHLEDVVAGFNTAQATQFVLKGYLGVDVFFILSGFVLAHVYRQQADAGTLNIGRFYWARLARIYPMHMLTFVALLGIAPFKMLYLNKGSFPLTDTFSAIANVFLVHAWGILDELSWNFPSWSLSAEWGAYLVFPILIATSLRVANRPLILAGIAFEALLIWSAVAYLNSGPDRSAPFDKTYDFGLIRVGAEFLIGILMFRITSAIQNNISESMKLYSTPSLMFAALIILHFDWAQASILQDFSFVVVASLLIMSLVFGQSFMDRALQGPTARYLGEISYGIYLWHGVILTWLIVMRRADNALGANVRGWLNDQSAASALAVTIFLLLTATRLAALSFRCFETPMRNMMRSWWDNRYAPG